MNYFSTKVKFVILMVFMIVVPLFFYLDVPHSLFFWLSCGVLGYLPISRLSKADQSYVKEIYILSYLLISLLGLIITFDNYENFGIYFGYAADDTRFYEKADQLLRGTVPEETGAYPIILSCYGQFVKLFTGHSYVLTDFLPLNWVFSAWTVVISGLLANFFSKKKCPFFILLIAVILNFKFMDSATRLYRDAFMLFFFLVSVYLLIRVRKKGYLVFTFLTGLLRVANALLSLLLAAILIMKKRITGYNRFYIIMGVGCMLFFVILLQSSFNFLAYMSSASRIGRYHEQFSGYSYKEAIDQRSDSLISEMNEDSLTGYAFGHGAFGQSLKVPINYFFPLTFNSPFDVKKVHSVNANIEYAKGFYTYEIVMWFTIFAWPIIVPMIAIGVLDSFKKSDWHAVMLVYYMILIFAVPIISGQIRHCCVYVVLTPIFANLGYWKIVKDRGAMKNAILLGIFFAVVIGVWNYIKLFR